jgi:2-C-methyl-D-erythritol 4-phosphate cytidylyltransferase
MIVRSRAKVNLNLYITGRRPDGYHTVDTVYQPIGLHDTLELEPADAFSFACSRPELENAENLAVKAYALMKRSFHLPDEFAVNLDKKIPSEAGLGGGSSDAAALMNALSDFYGGCFSRPELEKAAAALGADVPALLRKGPSRGRGTGTQLTPLASRAALSFLIVKPPVSCPTKEMYQAWDALGSQAFSAAEIERRQAELEEALIKGDVRQIASLLHNDFEAVLSGEAAEAFRKAKELLEEAGALNALLCGSGSAVLGLFADAETRSAAASGIRRKLPAGWKLFSCENTKEKPLSCGVIIAAGGSGSRFGGAVNKIFAPLKGEPVLAHTLKVFYRHPAVKKIVIPCRPEDKTQIEDVVSALKAEAPISGKAPKILLTEGGAERRDSVRNALAHIREKLVLIHDAARPFVKPRAVDDCLEALRDYPAVSLAVPSRDTVKLTNERGEVLETTDRPNTWLVQTPQGFDRALLEEAHRRFAKRPVTDDCTLMEQAGRNVKLVMGDYGNRKITVPEDLE